MGFKRMRSPRMAVWIIGLTAMALFCLAQAPRQVKVIIDGASIRSRPELGAEILDVAAKGAVFEVIEKADHWYAIKVGEDETGSGVYGFIHESMVESAGDILPEPPEPEKPPPVPQPQVLPEPAVKMPSPPEREAMPPEVEVWSREEYLSGSFLKYGFNDHWAASFGYDYGIGRYVGIGLEFQPYVSNLSAANKTTIQLDIFINLKLGFKVGFFTFYGGGGAGPDLSYKSAEVEGDSLSQFETRLAYHGIAGAAVNIGKIAVVFEYQPTWIREPDVSPDAPSHFFFIGLRF